MHIAGVGLWSPGYADAAAFLARTPDPAVAAPAVDIVASRMKRATSIATRSAVEVVTQAARAAGWDLAEFATVFASQHGEIQIAVEQMRMMKEDNGIVSPARFKNSVHNTAAGMFSIGGKNRGFTTAVAAGDHSLALALFEAWMLLASHEQSRVVVSIVEEPLPDPITEFSSHQAMAVAFALELGEGPSLGCPVCTHADEARPTLDESAIEGFEGHTAEGALRILRLRHANKGGHVALSEGSANLWSIELRP
jgi:hypothetical protein